MLPQFIQIAGRHKRSPEQDCAVGWLTPEMLNRVSAPAAEGVAA
jgi:hypothetical protein